MEWVISDPHFGHSKIIKYCNRPFIDANHMDTTILDNINKVVAPKDHLIILGDFTFKYPNQYRDRIKCDNVSLVPGNHDRWIGQRVATRMVILPQIHVVTGYAVPVVLCHYPLWEWPHKYHGALHLYGHIHNNSGGPVEAVNVCVEHTNYGPLQLSSLVKRHTLARAAATGQANEQEI